ncbi:DHBP synthase RibB-like alpha/beta domain-containing protein [Xylaria arbuscula]|uniref:Threonylcarbamoyl-AMP synthase n=1 Tax=Xylaria arbuscula TaxID=114810 RepID=A0A9W8NM57_9PEZI|nr:DHBP synthase RibB-like alpha/beta domain-containing protein [Xylaria arbuscula]KAJ3579753.1 hypothetical protein NPX13_g814 [Xylaria arbuscula]
MAPRIIPAPGVLPNYKRDAQEAFEVLKAGGVIIIPTDFGYGLMSASNEAIERSFKAKNRVEGHTLGAIGTFNTFKKLCTLPDEKFEMIRVLNQDMDQAFNVVAPLQTAPEDHPLLKHLDPENLKRVTKDKTIGINIGESPFMRELGRLNDEAGQLMVGSSANLTGTGQKLRVQDLEEQVYESADLLVDYGLQRYHRYQRSGTIIDVESMRILRIGAGYEIFRERVKQWWGYDLIPDPVNKTDHVGVGHSVKTEYAQKY